MRIAVDPCTERKINTYKFIVNYGNDTNDRRHYARCIVCNATMSVVGNHSEKRIAHFRHREDFDCPTKKNSRRLFDNLPKREIDEYTIMTKKSAFEKIIVKTYLKCHSLCKSKLKFEEFFNTVTTSTKKGLWASHDLDVRYIPYILLSYNDLTPRANRSRRYSLRFVFLNEIQTPQDLWIWPENKAGMIMLTFQKNVITNAKLLKLNALFMEKDWLTEKQKEFIEVRVRKIIGLR